MCEKYFPSQAYLVHWGFSERLGTTCTGQFEAQTPYRGAPTARASNSHTGYLLLLTRRQVGSACLLCLLEADSVQHSRPVPHQTFVSHPLVAGSKVAKFGWQGAGCPFSLLANGQQRQQEREPGGREGGKAGVGVPPRSPLMGEEAGDGSADANGGTAIGASVDRVCSADWQ